MSQDPSSKQGKTDVAPTADTNHNENNTILKPDTAPTEVQAWLQHNDKNDVGKCIVGRFGSFKEIKDAYGDSEKSKQEFREMAYRRMTRFNFNRDDYDNLVGSLVSRIWRATGGSDINEKMVKTQKILIQNVAQLQSKMSKKANKSTLPKLSESNDTDANVSGVDKELVKYELKRTQIIGAIETNKNSININESKYTELTHNRWLDYGSLFGGLIVTINMSISWVRDIHDLRGIIIFILSVLSLAVWCFLYYKHKNSERPKWVYQRIRNMIFSAAVTIACVITMSDINEYIVGCCFSVSYIIWLFLMLRTVVSMRVLDKKAIELDIEKKQLKTNEKTLNSGLVYVRTMISVFEEKKQHLENSNDPRNHVGENILRASESIEPVSMSSVMDIVNQLKSQGISVV